MVKHLLVAVDGSAHAEAAQTLAMTIARRCGAVLHGVHVVDATFLEGAFVSDVSGALGFEPFINMQAQMRAALEDVAGAIAARFEQRCREGEVPCQFHLERGSVVHGLLQACRLPDLLAMGRRGVNARFHPDLLGSATAAMLRRSPIPVLVVPEDPPSLRTVLVAYDGSPKAVGALRHGAALVQALAARLVVATVATQAEQARPRLEEAARYLAPFGLPLELRPLAGDAVEEVLLRAITDGEADALVLGAHGHGRIVELVLGSTSEYLARRAPVPVLCVTRA